MKAIRISKPPEERRAELIAAARRLFDARGVDKTRVSDIVHDVGVTQGVFYYYFASKNEMISAVVGQVDAELELQVRSILLDEARDFYGKLAAMIELYLALVDQFLGDDEISLTRFELPTFRGDSPTEHCGKLLTKYLLHFLRQGAKNGFVPIAYPEETALVLISGMWERAHVRLHSRHMIYTLVEQCLGLPKNSLVPYAASAGEDLVPALSQLERLENSL